MNKVRSIKQNSRHNALPNFRSLGVTLRVLLISNGMALLLAITQSNHWGDIPPQMMLIATMLTPILLASLLVLWAAQPWLNQLTSRRGALAVTALVLVLTLLVQQTGNLFYEQDYYDNLFNAFRYGLLSIIVSGILLLYFWLRSQVLSRAIHDARLQALRARIRPHFLFNTINTVLSILRAHPKRAETALENMADLFRVAMTDMKDLVPIQREIELCRQYAEIEQLRMGNRLEVNWQVSNLPAGVLIPPLLLQPLLENAVYHGIEPLQEGGTIDIQLSSSGGSLRIKVENPCPSPSNRHRMADSAGSWELTKMQGQESGRNTHDGNQIALKNIRERLALLYDAEAHYKVESGDEYYRVEIVMPYLRERTS